MNCWNFGRQWSAARDYEEVRQVISRIGPIPNVIPLKLFLDILRDPVFPRGLTDSQSYVPIFSPVDSWANSHAVIRVVRDLASNKNGGGCGEKYILWTNVTF